MSPESRTVSGHGAQPLGIGAPLRRAGQRVHVAPEAPPLVDRRKPSPSASHDELPSIRARASSSIALNFLLVLVALGLDLHRTRPVPELPLALIAPAGAHAVLALD